MYMYIYILYIYIYTNSIHPYMYILKCLFYTSHISSISSHLKNRQLKQHPDPVKVHVNQGSCPQMLGSKPHMGPGRVDISTTQHIQQLYTVITIMSQLKHLSRGILHVHETMYTVTA